jgi:hypothetical protein
MIPLSQQQNQGRQETMSTSKQSIRLRGRYSRCEAGARGGFDHSEAGPPHWQSRHRWAESPATSSRSTGGMILFAIENGKHESSRM